MTHLKKEAFPEKNKKNGLWSNSVEAPHLT